MDIQPGAGIDNSLSEEALAFLRQKHKNAVYSPADAYIFLLYHAIAGDNIMKRAIADNRQQLQQPQQPSSDGFSLIVTNFTALAAEWHWDRATVRKFIKQLQELGLLIFDQQGKELDIYMND